VPIRAVVALVAALAVSDVSAHGGPDDPAAPYLEAAEAAAQLPRLRSLLVSVQDELVLERYFGGARATQPANIKSASKSVISALVGLAVARGVIPDVRQPIVTYFPELAKDRDPRKQAITIEDLLTMRAGFESTSGRNYGRWVTSPNWVRFVLSRPLVSDPGTRVEYSTGNSHLLSAILTKAAKTSTWQFAQEQLAKPLGITLARWPQDPQGVYFGGNEMLMTPRQMIEFGRLYVNGGRVGDRQVLDRAWIDRSFVPRGRSRWGSDREYGYGWWVRELGGHPTYYAWGYGGQFIFVVPDRQMVVVTTSRSDVSRERRDHNEAIYDIVEDLIVKSSRVES
jgi:CubicO group peptidase (beta-lactamase class C family)